MPPAAFSSFTASLAPANIGGPAIAFDPVCGNSPPTFNGIALSGGLQCRPAAASARVAWSARGVDVNFPEPWLERNALGATSSTAAR
jgi:hypothetical protein